MVRRGNGNQILLLMVKGPEKEGCVPRCPQGPIKSHTIFYDNRQAMLLDIKFLRDALQSQIVCFFNIVQTLFLMLYTCTAF